MNPSTLQQLSDLSGRTAVITGAAGHIGYAICEALAELSADIILIDANRALCVEKSRKLHEDYQVETIPLVIDLADERSLRTIPESIQERYDSVEILVHCAALVGTSELTGWSVPFLNQSSETWRKALEINLTAPFFLTQLLTPFLMKGGKGSVINIGSIYGMLGPDMKMYTGTNMGNPAAYAASKAGLLQMTRWLSTVLAPDIRVNSISLGGIYRGQDESFVRSYCLKTPLNRMGTEDDIKGAVAFLSSDLSSYVTGQNIIIDGGWSAW